MIERADIAVAGAGAAGIAAAVTAARLGCKTMLLDQRPRAGGTGGHAGLTTLCGLYDSLGSFINDGFAREFAEAISETASIQMGKVWVLPYRPEKFRQAASSFLKSCASLSPLWNTPLAEVKLESDRITSINGIRVGAVIDCTGTAEIARAAGAECLETNEATQAPAVVFPLHNIQRDLSTPAAVAQALLPLARAGFPPLHFQPAIEQNAVTVKFTGRPEQARAVIGFLRSNVSGFENCSTPLTEFTLARRAGRMIIGDYVLTGADVLEGRKFQDAVARCAWPIEQWGPDGYARYQYLPPGKHYEVPARSLRSRRIRNLFMAGKTISADTDAIASARVMGCCLATGEAAATLAVNHLQTVGRP